MNLKTILVTGGAGYIGSHCIVELLNLDYKVVVVDNLSNSTIVSIDRVQKLTGRQLDFVQLDLTNKKALNDLFEVFDIDAVVHFAGLKAVGESVELPLSYYQNNVGGTINLLEVMRLYEVKNLVFSSSATVYGEPKSLPIKENFALSSSNPYGRSKLLVESILNDLVKSDATWNVSILRYFNPVGAHESGVIGEDPSGLPNNLMPYLSQVAVGRRSKLMVFGDDYSTSDGTGVRDYIHVVDLAKGHICALKNIADKSPGLTVHNLGTGVGYSVLEMVEAMETASGQKIPFDIVGRRAGDVAACYADASLAKDELGWVSHMTLSDMCADTWKWQMNNPNGYSD